MRRLIPQFYLCVMCFFMLACGLCSSEPVHAPPADEELSNAHSTDQKVIAQDSPNHEAPSAPVAQKKSESMTARPVIAGFSDILFGMTVEEAKKNRALRERCYKRPFFGKRNPENPDQKIEEWFGLCVAKFAGKKAKMYLDFDHDKRLYEIEFVFATSFADNLQPLARAEVEPFVAELRGVLEPSLGAPIDESQKSMTGSTDYELLWEGRTDDSPPHEVRVKLSISDGVMGSQRVVWRDLSREQAKKDAIELERRELLKSKGL